MWGASAEFSFAPLVDFFVVAGKEDVWNFVAHECCRSGVVWVFFFSFKFWREAFFFVGFVVAEDAWDETSNAIDYDHCWEFASC